MFGYVFTFNYRLLSHEKRSGRRLIRGEVVSPRGIWSPQGTNRLQVHGQPHFLGLDLACNIHSPLQTEIRAGLTTWV
jgi:hypothetical protein